MFIRSTDNKENKTMSNNVTLKNGSQEPAPVVTTTMMLLRSLCTSDPICFYELTMKCRDNNHQLFGNCASKLQGLSLLQSDGTVYHAVKNVVLSAVTGEDLDMALGSPIA
jgi:hypothetical protein